MKSQPLTVLAVSLTMLVSWGPAWVDKSPDLLALCGEIIAAGDPITPDVRALCRCEEAKQRQAMADALALTAERAWRASTLAAARYLLLHEGAQELRLRWQAYEELRALGPVCLLPLGRKGCAVVQTTS